MSKRLTSGTLRRLSARQIQTAREGDHSDGGTSKIDVDRLVLVPQTEPGYVRTRVRVTAPIALRRSTNSVDRCVARD